MGNVIEFKAVSNRQKMNHKQSIVKSRREHQCVPALEVEGCKNPIAVERIGWDLVAIGFRLDCFDSNLADLAMKLACHPQHELYKAGRENPSYDRMRSTYIVRATGVRSLSEADEMLTQIVAQSAKEAYSKETSMRGSEVDVSELATPYAADPFSGSVINRETVAILRKAGMENAYEIAKNTRETLCKLPGMTTKEVYKLEKSLATRGLYLNAAPVPSWKE